MAIQVYYPGRDNALLECMIAFDIVYQTPEGDELRSPWRADGFRTVQSYVDEFNQDNPHLKVLRVVTDSED